MTNQYFILNKKMRITQLILVFIVVSSQVYAQVAYTSCAEDANRQCPNDINQTQYLLNLKKGGTDVLSTNTYLEEFFLCQQYNYDCGYIPQNDSYINVANGVDLNMTVNELDAITTNTSTQQLIEPYLGTNGQVAKCGIRLFPLILTKQQSKQVLDGFMGVLAQNVTVFYDQCRNTSATKAWSQININIRTAILQKLKANDTMINNSTFWDNLCINNFVQLSNQLKSYYEEYDQLIDLHAGYLIDSVTQKCNKQQSVNFLVDESGSIGFTSFQLAKQFLKLYVETTNDTPQKMSIHFYSNNFNPQIQYGNNKSYIINAVVNKPYPGGGTYTGKAMNSTVEKIKSGNYPNGLPKVMVVLTDGKSSDSVKQATQNALNNGIIPIAVGIGQGVDVAQLIQIASTPSNYIQINSYLDLPKLVDFISNYFCKQILTIRINQTIYGNYVRVPTSPSFFRVQKSPATQGQYYQLNIVFQDDPTTHNQSIDESQIDPFPDQFTEYTTSQHYEIFNVSVLSSTGNITKPMKVYFIEPQNQIQYTVKKNINATMNATVSYVSVRGVALPFNISLKVCKTLSCAEQKQYYQSLSGKKKNDPIPIIDQLIIIPQAQDLSIFIVIGSTLAVLAALCCLGIFIYRRRSQKKQEQQQKLGGNRQTIPIETIPTQQYMQQSLVPAATSKKMFKPSNKLCDRQSGSDKSSRSRKSSNQSKSSNQKKSRSRSKSKQSKQSNKQKTPKKASKQKNCSPRKSKK